MKTIIPVMYRDGDNYKEYGSIAVRGDLSEAHVEALRGTLGNWDGDSFIPAQLGMRHMAEGNPDFPSFPNDADHCWHEMQLDDITTGPDDQVLSFVLREYDSAEDLIAEFRSAKASGWDEVTYAVDADDYDTDDDDEPEPVRHLSVVQASAGAPSRAKTTPGSTAGSFAPRSYADPGSNLI